MDNYTTVTMFLLWGFFQFPRTAEFTLCYDSTLPCDHSPSKCISYGDHQAQPQPSYPYVLFPPCSVIFRNLHHYGDLNLVVGGLATREQDIFLHECATQMFFFFGLAANNCFILSAISYDRYTAIYKPLHYPIFMTRKICFQLVMASGVVGFSVSLYIVIIIFNLSFCNSNIIQHFFCDIAPVVALACNCTFLQKTILLALTVFVLVGNFILIMISYVFIVSIVVKMPSAKERYKTLSTCSSHFTVVFIHYGFACFVYLRPKNHDTFRDDTLMTVAYTVLTPLLNPIIYSLKNKDMQTALRKILDHVIKGFLQMLNKRARTFEKLK